MMTSDEFRDFLAKRSTSFIVERDIKGLAEYLADLLRAAFMLCAAVDTPLSKVLDIVQKHYPAIVNSLAAPDGNALTWQPPGKA